MVLVVVQPEDHGRVLRDRQQQITIVAHALLAEQLDLFQQLVVVVDLGIAGGEHMVPEQRHLLLQRALGVHQIVHVVDVAHRRLAAGQQRRRLMAQQHIRIDRRLGLGVQQFLDRRLVPLGHARFESRRGWLRSPHAASGGPSKRCRLGLPCSNLLLTSDELLANHYRHLGPVSIAPARRVRTGSACAFRNEASVPSPCRAANCRDVFGDPAGIFSGQYDTSSSPWRGFNAQPVASANAPGAAAAQENVCRHAPFVTAT